jgi:hypothetical protein
MCYVSSARWKDSRPMGWKSDGIHEAVVFEKIKNK